MWGSGPKTLQGSISGIPTTSSQNRHVPREAGWQCRLCEPVDTLAHSTQHPLRHPWEVLPWVGTYLSLCPPCLAALGTGTLCWGGDPCHLHPPTEVIIILPPQGSRDCPSTGTRQTLSLQQVPAALAARAAPAHPCSGTAGLLSSRITSHWGCNSSTCKGTGMTGQMGHGHGQTATLTQNGDGTTSTCAYTSACTDSPVLSCLTPQ